MSHIARAARAATSVLSFAVGLSLIAATASATDRFAVQDGYVVHYTDAGSSTRLNVGHKCTDLWVAPDESAIAFVAVEDTKKAEGAPLGYEPAPLVQTSSVYVARRSAGFAPILALAQPIVVDSRPWRVFRAPSLSPDGRHLYVAIPFTMTTSKIADVSLADGSYEIVGNATDYCVIWNGTRSGDILIQQRHLSDDPSQGVSYRCYLVRQPSATGGKTNPAELSDQCDPFKPFVSKWTAAVGGSCKVPRQR